VTGSIDYDGWMNGCMSVVIDIDYVEKDGWGGRGGRYVIMTYFRKDELCHNDIVHDDPTGSRGDWFILIQFSSTGSK